MIPQVGGQGSDTMSAGQGSVRLDCLAITDAMKMTPTATMEVLLGLPPLHVVIEAKV